MTRKVSMWIVLALVGALAATTAAVIVLATRDGDGRAAAARSPGESWSHGWSDAQGERQLPVMGDMRAGWGGGREAPVLPWVLFAIATGTAVGLLVAWSPWRTAPAGAVSGPPGVDGDLTQITSMAVTEASVSEESSEKPPEG